MMNVRSKIIKKERWVLLLIFSLIVIFITVDIIGDFKDNLPIKHFIHELGLLALSLVGACYQMTLIWDKNKTIVNFTKQIQELEQEKQNFKERFSRVKNEFSEVVDQQFNSWDLSPVEKDIALLLIKGLSMKEIANTRNTSEGTVRQQATSIYKKSKLMGRQELAAFFLDELFM